MKFFAVSNLTLCDAVNVPLWHPIVLKLPYKVLLTMFSKFAIFQIVYIEYYACCYLFIRRYTEKKTKIINFLYAIDVWMTSHRMCCEVSRWIWKMIVVLLFAKSRTVVSWTQSILICIQLALHNLNELFNIEVLDKNFNCLFFFQILCNFCRDDPSLKSHAGISVSNSKVFSWIGAIFPINHTNIHCISTEQSHWICMINHSIISNMDINGLKSIL
jgi:hypothetical protein